MNEVGDGGGGDSRREKEERAKKEPEDGEPVWLASKLS